MSWKSRKQSVTATSSTELKYIALSLASKEGIWLCRFLLEIDYTVVDVQRLTIFGDNQPAIALTVNYDHHFKMKHIAMLFHFVREKFQKGIISMKHISTKEMPADGFTKPLIGIVFASFITFLGLKSTPDLTLPTGA